MPDSSLILLGFILVGLFCISSLVTTLVLLMTFADVRRALERFRQALGKIDRVLERTAQAAGRVQHVLDQACNVAEGALKETGLFRQRMHALWTRVLGNNTPRSRAGNRVNHGRVHR